MPPANGNPAQSVLSDLRFAAGIPAALAARGPAWIGSRLVAEIAVPWASAWCFLLVAPFIGRQGNRALAWAAAFTGLGCSLAMALTVPRAGQYGLVLLPVFTVGLALAFERVSSSGARRGRAWLLGAVLLHMALALPGRAWLAADPDREWAIAVSRVLRPGDIVIAAGSVRRANLQRESQVTVLEFPTLARSPKEKLVEELPAVLHTFIDRGVDVYFDEAIFRPNGVRTVFPGVVEAIEKAVPLLHGDSAGLLRVALGG